MKAISIFYDIGTYDKRATTQILTDWGKNLNQIPEKTTMFSKNPYWFFGYYLRYFHMPSTPTNGVALYNTIVIVYEYITHMELMETR